MAKITKIKASDGPSREEEVAESVPAITREKVVVKDKKEAKTAAAEKRKSEKAARKKSKREEREKENNGKKPFILIRPLVYFGRYLRDAWRELRQVRWPSRKDTWKMVLAVLVYTALFIVIITLLDLFFSWLFSLIIK